MRVMVTGAAGQLGSTFVQRLSGTHSVLPFTRADLDIASDADVARSVREARPDVILNCAAYNDVDGAERDAPAALRGNAFGVLALARAARDADAVFVHYSTDFVFDGRATVPYVETDTPRPLGTYGSSKLLGEWFAAEASQWYVLRVESLFGGPAAKSSIDRIIASLQAGQSPRAFADRTVSPSYVEDVAAATEALLARRAPPGLYHCVNSGATTWLEIAREVARLLSVSTGVEAISVKDVQFAAKRPQYCALSNEKLARAGVTMPTWRDALERYVTTIARDAARSAS